MTPNISGFRAADVAGVLSEIKRTGKVPGGARVALIFEGGAMRALLSCEYGLAVANNLPREAFAITLGSSAGAINAIYFVAGLLELGPSVYTDNATDAICTNPWNFPDVLNVDWLVNNWLFGPKAFDHAVVTKSATELLIVLTRLSDGKPEYFDAKNTDLATLKQAMKATSYAPLLTTKVQEINGVEYGDGAIADAVPYHKAVEMGATHIVCLVTRTPSYRKSFSPITKVLHAARLAMHTREYRHAYFGRAARYNATLSAMYQGDRNSIPTMVIHPASEDEIPSSIERSPAVLKRFGQLAFERANDQLRGLLN